MINRHRRLLLLALPLTLCAARPLPSTPDLGKAEATCRPNEPGPALLVDVAGLKDRKGRLKLEVYPADDDDFLQDDNILVNTGKPFRRLEVPVSSVPVPELCIRVPEPGSYAISLLHDRDMDRKFTLSADGIGFSGNPKLGWSKPKVANVAIAAGPGTTRLRIILNYRRGLLSFAPLSR